MARLERAAARRYAWTVAVAGHAVLAWTIMAAPRAWVAGPTLWIFSALVVLSELKPVTLRSGREAMTLALSTVFGLALLLTAGPGPAMAAFAAAALTAGVVERQPAWKVAFNAGQLCVSIGAGALVLEMFPYLGREAASFDGAGLLVVLAAGLTYWASNTTLVAVGMSLASKQSLGRMLRGDVRHSALVVGPQIVLAPLLVAVARHDGVLLWTLLPPLAVLYKAAEQSVKLARQDERFRSVVQNAADPIWIVDSEGMIAYATPSAGAWRAVTVGRALPFLVHPEDAGRLRSALRKAAARPGENVKAEFRISPSGSRWRSFDAICKSALDADGAIVVNARDITERKALEAELAHRAFHDSLTALPNRALFDDRLEQALARARRSGTTVGVLFLDLDGFKLVNDSLGHAAGDALLVTVGGRIARALREADTVARLGGDEFAVLIEDAPNVSVLLSMAHRIRQSLAAGAEVAGREMRVSASIGVAVSPAGALSREEVLRNADIAMYRAKSGGEGSVSLYQDGMHKAALERMELAADLRHAVSRGEMAVVYQPVFDLETGAIVGAEALVRWQHPTRGLLGPAAFVSLAEETGDIAAIGRFVLRSACEEARRWVARAANGRFTISVNVSPRQLRDGSFRDQVAEALAAAGLDAGGLILEVTESAIGRDHARMVGVLGELRAMGVGIAIDDFGTGHSSLGSLRALPADIVKIDKTFVDPVAVDHEAAALIAAILRLANTLHMRPVIEGIETREQAETLRALGCTTAQGYYLSRPVSAAQLDDLLSAAAKRCA